MDFVKIIKNAFQFPEIVEDERLQHARVFILVCGVTIFTLCVFIFYYALFDRSYNIVPMIVLILAAIISLVLNNRGSIDIATNLLVWAVLIGLLTLATVNEGLSDTALQVLPALLIVAALLLGRVQLILFSTISLLSLIVLGMLQINHLILHQTLPKISVTNIFDLLVIDGSTVILVMIVSTYLKKSFNSVKHEKELLKESEEKFRSSFMTSVDAFYIGTLDDGLIIEVNNSFKKVFGYTREEVIGKTSLQLNLYADPHDRARMVSELKANGHVNEMELKGRKKSGEIITVSLSVSKVLINGQSHILGVIRDISERKRVAEELEESREKYRGLSEAAFEAIFISEKGICIEQNTAAEKMFGYTSEEAVGKSGAEWIVANDRELVLKKMIAGVEEPYEATAVRKDGTTFPCILQGKMMHYSGRNVRVTSLRDITERKRAQEKLVKSEESLKIAQVIGKYGYWHFNLITGEIESSENYYNLFGFEPYGFEQSFENFKKRVYKEDRHIIEEGFKSIEKEKTPKDFELRVVKKDGTIGWQRYNIIPEIIEGKLIALGGTVQDITERKKAEEELRQTESLLRTVLNNAPITIFATDSNGLFTLSEGKGLESVGLKPAENVGLSAFDMYSSLQFVEESGNVILGKDLIRRVLAGETISVYNKLRGVHFHNQISPILNANGIVAGIVGVATDITERKQMEEALRHVQKMESIGVLASGIAHDFNNLLGAMMGNVSLAQMKMSPDHPSLINLDRTMTAIKHAAALTKQMLAYSGKGRFEIQTIDLVAVTQEHLGLLKSSLPKNVEIQTIFSQTPVYVNGDPGQMEQVVMNLMTNAGEAIGEKQGVVTVTVAGITMTKEELSPFGILPNTTLPEGAYAFLQVSDNGSGMTNETVEKIFDPFFTTKFIGRGLGLSAVLGIIRGHKGGVTIKSTEGVGTTLRVLLPLVSTHVPVTKTPKNETLLPAIEQTTILVIDDEQYDVEMMNDILEAGKYQSLSTTDPVVGVKMYEEQWRAIDIVILDYAMPKMNGKEVLIELRKINPDIKVIMVSGYTEEELVQVMGEVRPVAIIQKPHTADALLSIISKVLDVTM